MNIRKQFYKFLIGMTHLRGKTPPVVLDRAMARDPELLRHWKDEQQLSEVLRRETGEVAPVPADLREKILARIEPGSAKVTPIRQPRNLGWQMTAVAAILVFGTMVMVLRNDAPTGADLPSDPPVIENIPEHPDALITLESPIENHPLVQLSAIIESPLREEPQRLLNDAENALRFLSRSFMPSEAWRDEVSRRFFSVKSSSKFTDEA